MPGKERKTILLVDDEAIVALAEAGMLEKHGFIVLTAVTGEEAVRKVRDGEKIDLVLMDIDLGRGMDGTEAARIIVRERGLPVLFLSSHTEREIVEKTENITSYGYVVKNSGETVLLASIKMAFRLHDANLRLRHTTEEIKASNEELQAAMEELESSNEELMHSQNELQESEAYQRQIIDNAPFGAHFYRLENNFRLVFTGANRAADRILKIDHRPLLGKPIEEAFPGLVSTDIPSIYREIAGKGTSLERDQVQYEEGGISGAYEIRAFQTAPNRMAVFFSDITARKHFENALRESEEKFRFLAEKMGDVVWTLDLGLRTTYVSPSVLKVLGFTQEERKRQTLEEIMTPESRAKVLEILSRELEKEKEPGVDPDRVNTMEVEYYHKNGSSVWLENSMKALRDHHGTITGVYGVSRDITERRRAEAALEAALEEKNALFRELQHRVKNSLTMITSLVGLESEQARDAATKEALENLRGRINTLSNLYAMLYSGGETKDIRLDRYIQAIAQSLMDAYMQGEKRVDLGLSLADISIDAKKASSYGLILNELVTNALKYAFPGDRRGAIEVVLETRNGETVLEVADDGAGLPADFDMEKSRGLGLMLVRMLARQLDGSVECIRDGKTRFIVTLKR
jgi:PAS domain S-box-containing protein